MSKIRTMVTGETPPEKQFAEAGKYYSIEDLFTGKMRKNNLPLITVNDQNRRAIRYAESEKYITHDQAAEMIEADFISFSFLGAMMAVQYENKKIYSYGKIIKG